MNTQQKFTVICLSLVLCSTLFAQLIAIDREKLVNTEDIMKNNMTMTMNAEVSNNYPCPVDFERLLEETKQDLDQLEHLIAVYSSNNNINMNNPNQ
ncbi:hypothetical protein GWO43_17115 [candidate division KSB1 bacterium]|nr:hypothetical protein [candidate division KSB1 bacterium]NIR69183.1 hypothetical protein [candidate division KSB1 bacterium]NIS25694.1 hypothetical protein [candidate division KSB1 bacterium]NIT72562.1 hypothetical protein [candidate division KSB1 bacterium]NIU26371.1 hypothetical protein [candidate division KSB1 bacterium]